MKTIFDIVVTEVVGEKSDIDSGWFMNIGKFNDETDIRITEHLAKEILAEQKLRAQQRARIK